MRRFCRRPAGAKSISLDRGPVPGGGGHGWQSSTTPIEARHGLDAACSITPERPCPSSRSCCSLGPLPQCACHCPLSFPPSQTSSLAESKCPHPSPASRDVRTAQIDTHAGPYAYTLAVQEGVFLYTHNVSPYDGGVFHQAPLLLPLFSLLPDPSYLPFATSLLYTIVDLLSANAIAQIADSGQNVATRSFTSSRKDLKWTSLAIAAGYAHLSLRCTSY
jgi:hypothetical protein